ncbi:MAG TPA: hypothetical protein VI759_06255 [Dehalococcoidia bacterium]|nr:hypothetical protein [Dehalococcoidia bacterium]
MARLLLTFLLFAAAAACSGDKKPPATPTPPDTATAVASPSATRSPTPRPSGSTRQVAPLSPGTTLTPGVFEFELANGRFWPESGEWSPDGSHKLVSSDCGPASYSCIELTDLDAGRARVLISEGTNIRGWSPKGDAILYTTFAGGEYDNGLFLQPLAGGPPKQIDITGLQIGRGARFIWRPGHNEFAIENTADFSAVYLLDIDDSTKNKRIIAPQTQYGVPVIVDGWSHDGRWLLLREFSISANVGGNLYAYDMDNDSFLTLYVGCCATGAWSPTRNDLLLGITSSELQSQMYLLTERDFLNPQAALSRPPLAVGGNANWSPDGNMIAYSVMKCGNDDWYTGVVNRDGSGNRRLPGQMKAYRFQNEWSPDGRYIAYAGYFAPTADHGSSGIFMYDLAASREIALVMTPPPPANLGDTVEPLRLGSWSPDGRFLGFNLGFGFGFCD